MWAPGLVNMLPVDVPSPDILRARGGLKWTYYDENVLASWVAEMDYGIAPAIADALHDAINRGDVAYPYPDAARRTAGAAVGFWKRDLNWAVDPDQVFAVPDVVVGIQHAITQLTPPGSPVALHTPVYFPFFNAIAMAGRQVIQVPAIVDSSGPIGIDIDALADAFASGAGSVILCNPWNPTGRALTADEVASVIDVASAHGARVISDEIHAPFVFEGFSHTVAANLAPETVITVTSASKAWNLPGLKCGQVILGNEEDLESWSALGDNVGVGTLGLVAAAAAYAEGGDWLNDVKRRLASNRQLLDELMAEHLPDIGYRTPEATYLAWLDFRRFGLQRPAHHLIERAGVALTEGAPFGVGGAGWARLNFATSPEILTEVVGRIAAAL